MKFSKNFERDYKFYIDNLNIYNFDASLEEEINDKITIDLVNGFTAKECFYVFDSQGKKIPTKEPELLFKLFKCKGSINFNIKMWAEARSEGLLPLIEFSVKECVKKYGLTPIKSLIKNYGKKEVRNMINNDYENSLKLPEWVIKAVENQTKSKFK